MLQWISENFKGELKRTTVWRIVFVSVVFLFSFFLIGYSKAQSAGADIASTTQVVGTELGLPDTDLRVIIARVIRVALGLLGIVLLVIVLYGGFLWMTAGGNENQISTAKKVLLNSGIGLAVILSSYGIVTFVMWKLTGATGGGFLGLGGGGGNIQAFEQNFFGSGGLGGVIKDHYPSRGQSEVPRNAKIIITFRPAVLPSSFITNTNGTRDANNNEIFGDCIKMGDADFSWEQHCDQLILNSENISVARSDNNEQIRGAVAMVSYDNGKAYTVVIRPLDNFGSDDAKIAYKVRVGKNVKIDDSTNGNPSIFAGKAEGRDFYEWEFACSMELDMRPPYVTSVYPSADSIESKNSVIQINFSKPMDPTGLQGEFSTSTGFFVLRGNNVYLKSNSALPAGSFRMLNNYQTLEFTPTTACGENACGGTIYCLPVSANLDTYEVLVRAAQTFTTSSFESVPFSGAMDISGNALDGNNDGKVNQVDRSSPVFPNQVGPDNYGWKFNLEDKMDLTAPYIQKTTPGPEATFIGPSDELSMIFSKRMRVDSLYSIGIEEFPVGGEPLCRTPRAYFSPSNTTYVRLDHCPFLSEDDARHYYYPLVDSRVEDVHFNCFYPGVGPITLDSDTKSSRICDPVQPGTCCNVGMDQDSNAFCCNGFTNYADKQQCLNYLRTNSPQ